MTDLITVDMIEAAAEAAFNEEMRPNKLGPYWSELPDEMRDHYVRLMRGGLMPVADLIVEKVRVNESNQLRWHLNEALSLIRELHPIHVHNGCERCQLWVDGVKALKAESS